MTDARTPLRLADAVRVTFPMGGINRTRPPHAQATLANERDAHESPLRRLQNRTVV